MSNEYLTTEELADRLKVNRVTLARWRQDGSGPQFIKVGKGKSATVRYPIEAINEWVRGIMQSHTL